ncbi:MAG: c-type cytochrome domain-containing protein [Planctomycetota bacterium]|jgi:mono/diheme cytochrome c family protein
MRNHRSVYFSALAPMLAGALASSFAVGVQAQDAAKITYDDHIKPIFREHCSSCHNNNAKKGGLSLESYQATMAGGSSGEVLVAGDLDASRLYALTAHKEQPTMPPMQDKIAQAKIDLLKTWVEQGMPENSGSAIRKPMANAAAISVAAAGRPEGPPPMPASVLKQTPLYTAKASSISALGAAPWSPLIAVGGQRQVTLYHSVTGQLMGILPFPEGEPQSITFSRDGKLILIGGGRHSVDGYAVLCDLATGNRIAKVGDELDIVMAADISDDNRLIALAGPQKMVRVYDTLTGERKWEQKKHTDWIYAVRFSPDGLLLATADRAAGLVIWESATGKMYADLQGHKNEIRSLAWRPDSGAVVSASLDGTLKMWDMNESKLLKSWDAHPGGAAAIAIANDGVMVSTGKDRKVKVWDAAGNAAGEMPALEEAGQEVAITVDSQHVVSGDWLGNVRVWLRADPKDEKRLAANPVTLEMSIAANKERHVQLAAAAQAAVAELTQQAAQTVAVQKANTDHQNLIATYVAQITETTNVSNQLKATVDMYAVQIPAKQAEVAKVAEAIAAKTAQVNQVTAEKKQADDALAALQKQKEGQVPDPAALDNQIAEAGKVVEAKAAALTQATNELNALNAQKAQIDKEVVDLTAANAAKSKEYADAMNKLAELNKTKAAADKRLEELVAELKVATDKQAAAQAKADGANSSANGLAAEIAAMEQELARFNGLANEYAAKKTALETAIAQVNAEAQPVQNNLVAVKTKMEQTQAAIAQLEKQLAELQAMMAATQEAKNNLAKEMAPHQQALDAIMAKLQQTQGELSGVAAQQKLFEESYKK